VNPPLGRPSKAPMRVCSLLLVLVGILAGCTAQHAGDGPRASASGSTPVAVAAPNPWCSALQGLTADPSGDLTGKENSEARVLQVRSAHQVDQVMTRCPNVVSIGMTLAPIAEHLAAGDFDTWAPKNLRPSTGDARDWVITIGLENPEHMPQKSPLYLDGVRVYFEVTGRIEAL
jgi:hypothetical protein